MNFFERQAQSRRQTRWLALLFVLALLAVVLAVDVIVMTALSIADTETVGWPAPQWLAEHIVSLIVCSVAVLAVIGVASLYRSMTLSVGGGAVARDMSGTRVERGTQDPLRRRLFNVVEEMAIASGVPLPEIYVLEHETGINAFAAGHLPANAAIAVTRGALEKLDRSELQGVIAHEFSHILNGDMRLNTRLMGWLFGLLVIALIGRTVLRHGTLRTRRAGGVILVAALAIMILGYVAVFFGRLLQAAISRGRESLADASAVQFTREPQGLKGALVKIGGLGGSHINSPEAEEVAHMLFAPGLGRLFATHPPLTERIKALDPRFRESEFTAVRMKAAAEEKQRAAAEIAAQQSAGLGGLLTPAAIVGLVGSPGTAQMLTAQAVAKSMPQGVLEYMAQPGGAVSVLLALVLDPGAEVRGLQLQQVGERLGAEVRERLLQAETLVRPMPRFQKLPLLEELVPELRRLPVAERRKVLECLQRLMLIDGRIELFEYTLGTLARVYLQDDLQQNIVPHRLKLDQASVELQTVFSTLAQHGSADETAARRAYEMGMQRLLPQHRLPYRTLQGWPPAMDRALRCLDRLPPAGKEMLIEALVLTIEHDGRLTIEEAELLRAICAALHCPLPPLLNYTADPRFAGGLNFMTALNPGVNPGVNPEVHSGDARSLAP